MSSSNCCFLTCIQISQEAGQVVCYSHFFQNFPQFIVIHTVKGFCIVNKAEIDVFLELSCLFNDLADVGNYCLEAPQFLTVQFWWSSVWKWVLCIGPKSAGQHGWFFFFLWKFWKRICLLPFPAFRSLQPPAFPSCGPFFHFQTAEKRCPISFSDLCVCCHISLGPWHFHLSFLRIHVII